MLFAPLDLTLPVSNVDISAQRYNITTAVTLRVLELLSPKCPQLPIAKLTLGNYVNVELFMDLHESGTMSTSSTY